MNISFNCLNIIIEDIIKHAEPGKTEIIFAGNGRYVPVINEILKKNGLYISKHMDNDINKHGMEISEAFRSDYFREILPPDNRRKVFVYSPDEILRSDSEKLFVIQSINGTEIYSQLISLGVDSRNIIMYNKTSNEMMRDCGFVDRISEGRQKVDLSTMQSLELDLLHELDRFCKEKNIEYFLNSGTLIGAARHKGFIPWDDDIDVYMTPENYKRFMESYPDNEKYYSVDYRKDDNYCLSFGKLVNRETLLFHPGFPYCRTMGIYIDIFILAGYGDGSDQEVFPKENALLEDKWRDYFVARDMLGNDVRDVREEVMSQRYKFSYDTSSYVGARHFLLHIKSWCVKKELFEGKEELFFEDGMFPVPKGWHELLTERYGDYMKLPPEEKRQAHLFDAYL